jgi:hypothetical protein
VRDLGAFGFVTDTAQMKWEYLKYAQIAQMRKKLREWFLNPEACSWG